ncbi:MAG: protoporphyrinogen oxidase [Gammaproteobacteria bacterium]|nr:protoporphyrinogen oxidase [Gammaproteobacteria bacterium]
MNEAEVLIVGGGISGLSTAWWLAQQGVEVEVWEASERAGGKIHTTREQGYLSERAAGLLVNFRPEVEQMIMRAGLSQQRRMREQDIRRYVLNRGKLIDVPMNISGMARSPLWSRQAKLRMLCEILIPKRGDDQESVSAFINRRLGKEILETAIEPFVAGTLASDPDLANARALLPRLTQLEQRYGSITTGVLINRVLKRRRVNNADTFSFQGGMSDLVDALAATPGLKLRCGMQVEGIEREHENWRISATNAFGKQQLTVPALVISTPAQAAASLLRSVDNKLADQLDGIRYAPLGVVHLGMKRSDIKHPLDGSGFLVSRREKLSFSGNLWMSSLFSGRAPEGHELLTSYLGGVRDPDRLQQSDQQMMDSLLANLATLLGFRGEPQYLRVERHPQALPLYHGSYPQQLTYIRQCIEKLPGLHLCANYLDGVSVRERIYAGKETARVIRRSLPAMAQRFFSEQLNPDLC